MVELKLSRWVVPALVVVMSLAGGSAHASGIRLAQETSAPTVESAPAPEPRPISESKRRLIAELLELTGGEQLYEQTQQAILAQTEQQIQGIIGQTISSREDLSPAEAEQIRNNVSGLIAEVAEAMQSVSYDEILERVYYPVYDQYFTEEDLQGLIDFYQTPVGAKLVSVTPELVQTTTQLSSEIYLPRVFEVLNRVLEQPVN